MKITGNILWGKRKVISHRLLPTSSLLCHEEKLEIPIKITDEDFWLLDELTEMKDRIAYALYEFIAKSPDGDGINVSVFTNNFNYDESTVTVTVQYTR